MLISDMRVSLGCATIKRHETLGGNSCGGYVYAILKISDLLVLFFFGGFRLFFGLWLG